MTDPSGTHAARKRLAALAEMSPGFRAPARGREERLDVPPTVHPSRRPRGVPSECARPPRQGEISEILRFDDLGPLLFSGVEA